MSLLDRQNQFVVGFPDTSEQALRVPVRPTAKPSAG